MIKNLKEGIMFWVLGNKLLLTVKTEGGWNKEEHGPVNQSWGNTEFSWGLWVLGLSLMLTVTTEGGRDEEKLGPVHRSWGKKGFA